jgi:hypothetical protein
MGSTTTLQPRTAKMTAPRTLGTLLPVALLLTCLAMPVAAPAATQPGTPRTAALAHVAMLSWSEHVVEHSPAIAVGPEGHVVAAWSQRSGASSGIHVSRLDSAGRWSEPQLVPGSRSTAGGSDVSVGVDSRGRALLAWLAERREGLEVTSRRVTYAWALPGVARIAPSRSIGAGEASELALDVAATGRGVLAWTDTSDDGSSRVFASSVRPARAAGAAVHVDGSGSEVARLGDAAIASDGSALVVYAHGPSFPLGHASLRQVRIDRDGRVGAVEAIGERVLDSAGSPRLDSNATGEVLGTWVTACDPAELPCRDGIVVARRGTIANGLAGADVRLSNPGATPSLGEVASGRDPVPSIDESGRGLVTWLASAESGAFVAAAAITDGPVVATVKVATSEYVDAAPVGVLTGGRATWSWLEHAAAGAAPHVRTARGSTGRAGGLEVVDAPVRIASSDAGTPAIDASPDGTVVAVWIQSQRRLASATNVLDRARPLVRVRPSATRFRLDDRGVAAIPVTCPTGELHCTGSVVLRALPEKAGDPLGRVVARASGRIGGGSTRFLQLEPDALTAARIRRASRVLLAARVTMRDLRGNVQVVDRKWWVARRGIVLEE